MAQTDPQWRLLTVADAGPDAPPYAGNGAVNMAVDTALLRSVQAGRPPVLRFYTWKPACLSLGRNQPAHDVYDPDRAAAAGIDIVRRPTGGLAVLHDHELTYCVAAPLALLGGARAAYAAINAALVEGLREFGIPATQAPASAVSPGRPRGLSLGTTDPCFQKPAPGEVVAAGRKLVGSAQRCERGTMLQHGSILLGGSQTRVLDLLARPRSEPVGAEGSVTLKELLGREPDLDSLVSALWRGFERTFGTRLAPAPLARDEYVTVAELVGMYASTEWTWRR